MKRIIYYCFLVCSVLIINFQLKAQSDFTNILVHPISHNQTEPTITMDPMNSSHLFVGANVQYTYSEIGGYYSTSGINQWNGTDVLSLDNRYDPSAAYDLNHSLYYTYIKDNSKNSGYALDQQTYIIKSSNEGINFGSPKKLTASDYTGADKSFVAVDNYKDTNNVYVTWTDYSQGSLPKNDGGSNFNNYQISDSHSHQLPSLMLIQVIWEII